MFLFNLLKYSMSRLSIDFWQKIDIQEVFEHSWKWRTSTLIGLLMDLFLNLQIQIQTKSRNFQKILKSIHLKVLNLQALPIWFLLFSLVEVEPKTSAILQHRNWTAKKCSLQLITFKYWKTFFSLHNWQNWNEMKKVMCLVTA